MSTLSWEGNITAKLARANSLENKGEKADAEFENIMVEIKKACSKGNLEVSVYIDHTINQIHLTELGYELINPSKPGWLIKW
jgi:hypothetical protein